LRIHFVHVGFPKPDASSGLRTIDDLVLAALAETDQPRVITHNIPADTQDEMVRTGPDSFIGTVRDALGASIVDLPIEAEADSQAMTWKATYIHAPVGETGDVLLNLRFAGVKGNYDVQLLPVTPQTEAEVAPRQAAVENAAVSAPDTTADQAPLTSAEPSTAEGIANRDADPDAGAAAAVDPAAADVTADSEAVVHSAQDTGATQIGPPSTDAFAVDSLNAETPSSVLTMTTAEQQTDGTVEALGATVQHIWADGCAWLLVRNLPAGTYQCRLVFSDAQDTTVQVTLWPYRITPPRRAWITVKQRDGADALQENSQVPRGDFLVDVYTDALEIPAAKWQIELQANGAPVDAAFAAIEDMPGSAYHWQAQVLLQTFGPQTLNATLVSMLPNDLVLSASSTSFTIENRPPQVVQGTNRDMTAVFDVPGMETREKVIDLNSFFMDPDGETLRFTLAQSQTEQNGYSAYIDGSDLHYNPLSNEQKTVELTILAEDSAPKDQRSELPTVTLQITQQSLLQSMQKWAFEQGASEEATPSVWREENGDYAGALERPLSILYRMQGEEAESALALYQQAQQQYSLQDITQELHISIQSLLKDGEKQSALPDCTLRAQTADQNALTGLLLACELPAVDSETDYTVIFSAEILGQKLDKLMPQTDIHVVNTAPYLIDPEHASQSLTAEIDGAPDARVAKALSTITGKPLDLLTLFSDRENTDHLRFTIRVDGAMPVTVTHNQAEVEASAEGEGYKEYTLSPTEDTCIVDITFLEPGSATIAIRAKDTEKASADTLTYNVRLGSSHTRILLTVGISAAAALLICGIVLLLIWLNKPSFRGVFAGVSIVEPYTDSFGEYRPQDTYISLAHYHKRSVALSTLIVACRQPPVRGIDFDILDDIRIRPAKRDVAFIVCGARAKKAGIKTQPYQTVLGGAIDHQPIVLGLANSDWIRLHLTRAEEPPYTSASR
jgi:hypothetical protein